MTHFGHRPGIRLTETIEYQTVSGSHLLHQRYVSFVDHLGPFVCFGGDKLAKFGGRPTKHHAAEVGELFPHRWISERRVDRIVQAFDDFRWRTLWRAKPIKGA